MRRVACGRLRIWVTEFSWPATRLTPNLPAWARLFGEPITNAGQARLLSHTTRRLVAERRRLGIHRLLWYTWLSHETAHSDDPFDYAGLRRLRHGVRRDVAALGAFQRWARRLEGCAKSSHAQRCR